MSFLHDSVQIERKRVFASGHQALVFVCIVVQTTKNLTTTSGLKRVICTRARKNKQKTPQLMLRFRTGFYHQLLGAERSAFCCSGDR